MGVRLAGVGLGVGSELSGSPFLAPASRPTLAVNACEHRGLLGPDGIFIH